ncbi:MAG: Hsp20/alpha crystallin family protein [Spirochaetota bacterium]
MEARISSLPCGYHTQEEEEKTEEEGYIRRARYSRSFNRAFRLPSDVNQDKIEARFNKGVLTITMPRSGSPERESGRRIEIASK